MDMDLSGGVTVQPSRATRTSPIDSDTETPPRNPPHKRVHHANMPAGGVSYKECMKNHAASIGGHALDGCCEFMPGPTFNPSEPTSLKCGACGCHRNFHRRDPDDPTPLNHHPTQARRAHSPPTASQLLLSLSQSPSDEVNPRAVNISGGVVVGYEGTKGQNGNFTTTSCTAMSCGNSKKRFRTKFSTEQKEKMYEFSERIGWKLKKGEERLVEDFVKDIGVERNVFKVWMHNNKHASSSSSATKYNRVDPQPNNTKSSQDPPSAALVVPTTATTFLLQPNAAAAAASAAAAAAGKTNCGASLFDNHNHNHNHHRQFNFGNGGGQEPTQAQ
ncbi:hypothetical protein vseg_001804 [Gypsophila vaccaria]